MRYLAIVFVLLSACGAPEKGKDGEQGPTGIQGQRGEQGIPGSSGEQGVPGNDAALEITNEDYCYHSIDTHPDYYSVSVALSATEFNRNITMWKAEVLIIDSFSVELQRISQIEWQTKDDSFPYLSVTNDKFWKFDLTDAGYSVTADSDVYYVDCN